MYPSQRTNPFTSPMWVRESKTSRNECISHIDQPDEGVGIEDAWELAYLN
jgi:hypothetical protein